MKNFFKAFEKNVSKQVKGIGKGISDFDKDGVPNYRDCEPLNPKKHGVEPNILMKKRIEKLPIYVTDMPIDPKDASSDVTEIIQQGWNYPLFSKEAKKHAPKTRKSVLSILKNFPNLISEIKKKGPKQIIFTSQTAPKLVNLPHPAAGRVYGLACRELGHIAVVYANPSQAAKYFKKHGASTSSYIGEEIKAKKAPILSQAGTLRHELEHIKQFKKEEKKKQTKETRKMFKGEYEKQIGEKQAYRAQKKFVKKHTKEKKRNSPNILGSIFS